tara:strand:- start:6081 stop:6299 length:219 start_codon:yes stop_codon:yes gene_type:complete
MQIRAKSSPLVKALAKKLEGDIAVAQANIDVYLEQSVGIGEHPDVVQAIETQIEVLAAADEKLQILKKYYGV